MISDKIEPPSGLTIYHKGPPLKEEPLPAIFYFALSGEESLQLDPYNQPVMFLSDASIHIFSFTLPYHGKGFINAEAMAHWANAFSKNTPFLENFLNQVIENIHYLIEKKYVDPSKLAAAGLSRGGFMATQLAAREPLIKYILGYAPLTEPAYMEDFKGLGSKETVSVWSLNNIVDKVYNRDVRFYMGNRDIRVGTELCFNFIKNLTEEAYSKGIRSPPIELILFPSIGHKGHGTPPYIFKAGADWLKEKLCTS